MTTSNISVAYIICFVYTLHNIFLGQQEQEMKFIYSVTRLSIKKKKSFLKKYIKGLIKFKKEDKLPL